MLTFFQKIHDLAKSVKRSIDRKFYETKPPTFAFGIFGVINFPLFYIVWYFLTPQGQSDFLMRLAAAVFCVLLLLQKKWPEVTKEFFPLFWYVAVIYTLPFFGTYMFLKNHGSVTWLTNAMLGLFWLILIVDWFSFIIILPLGVFLGWFCYYLSGNEIYLLTENLNNNLFATISNFIWAIVVAAVFAHDKEKVQLTKLQTIKTIGASIAHELRTPLRAISSAANSIQKYFPILLKSYQQAKNANLNVPFISPKHYEMLLTACDDIEAEAEAAFTVINMLLMNVNSKIDPNEFMNCSISSCINEAIHRYPFDIGEAELINWEHENDFIFNGNHLLIIHVLFNLFKNSLYQIKAAGKGNIQIWTKTGTRYNQLHFKDTAKGVPSKILPHIFDKFFSRTHHGTGIGLAFCKLVMDRLKGEIKCYSEESEYAEFVLFFPVIRQNDTK